MMHICDTDYLKHLMHNAIDSQRGLGRKVLFLSYGMSSIEKIQERERYWELTVVRKFTLHHTIQHLRTGKTEWAA